MQVIRGVERGESDIACAFEQRSSSSFLASPGAQNLWITFLDQEGTLVASLPSCSVGRRRRVQSYTLFHVPDSDSTDP